MPLASSVKELEVILQKLTKSEPGLILVNNDNEKHEMASLAMRMTSCEVVGSVQQRNGNENVLSQELKKNEKKSF